MPIDEPRPTSFLDSKVSLSVSETSATLIKDAHLPTDAEKQKTFAAKIIGDNRPRAVLLNPPGTKKYMRDYFCTLVSKADYYYHPIDLIYLSGVLDHAGYYINCIDAIAENLSSEETIDRVTSCNPDLLIYLISGPSYEEDVTFLTKLRARVPTATFVGSGDVYREMREDALRIHPFCDVILTDFSTGDLLTWLNRKEDSIVENIIYQADDGRILAGPEKHGHGFYSLPIPRWDLWPLHSYRFPFSERKLWATMLTDFGCPFSCTFCPMSTTGYKLRDIDTVIDEMRFLQSLGVHEIFFRDQTFGANRARTEELLRRMHEEFPKLRWVCWTRVDVVNEEFLQLIAKSGCHTVLYGIETMNEEILKKYKKRTKRSQIEEALALSHRMGLKTVGSFVIGLPGESEESINRSIEYARQIPLDYASFNIASPRFGTTFRRHMMEHGAIDSKHIHLDSSRTRPSWQQNSEEETLPNETIYRLQRHAIRRFYLRPSYLLKRLLDIRTPYQFWKHVREAWKLLW